jgi:zinc transporter ZupT
MLLSIVIACFAGGVLSLLAAWLIASKLKPSVLGRFVAFAAGTMLTAAMLGMLPEALEMAPNKAHELCVVCFNARFLSVATRRDLAARPCARG